MPLPLAMMIPFMGIQSAVMAKQFGENFQYGKRRISAMSNEEFNALTPAKLQERTNAELKAMIPNMKQSIIDMQGFQEFLVKEFVKMIGDILTAGLGKIIGVTDDQVDQALQDIEHFIHGHFDLHKNGTVAQEDDPTKFQEPIPEPIPEPILEPTTKSYTDQQLNYYREYHRTEFFIMKINSGDYRIYDGDLKLTTYTYNDHVAALKGFEGHLSKVFSWITADNSWPLYYVYLKDIGVIT